MFKIYLLRMLALGSFLIDSGLWCS